MTVATLAGLVAGFLSLIAYLPYALDTMRGNAQPNRATWIIWTVVGGLLFASYNAAAGGAARWVPLADALGPALIAALAMRHGKGEWNRLDVGCLVLAGVSLIGWRLTGSPVVTLQINLFLAFLAAIPTFCSAYRNPGSEPPLVWGLFLLSNVLNLLAIDEWNWTSAAYPLYTVFTAGLVNALIWGAFPRPGAVAKSSESQKIADLHGVIGSQTPSPVPCVRSLEAAVPQRFASGR